MTKLRIIWDTSNLIFEATKYHLHLDKLKNLGGGLMFQPLGNLFIQINVNRVIEFLIGESKFQNSTPQPLDLLWPQLPRKDSQNFKKKSWDNTVSPINANGQEISKDKLSCPQFFQEQTEKFCPECFK